MDFSKKSVLAAIWPRMPYSERLKTMAFSFKQGVALNFNGISGLFFPGGLKISVFGNQT